MALNFSEKAAGLKFVVTNGTMFIGHYEKTDNGYVVKNAVEYNGDFDSTLKNWFKKEITKNHTELSLEGNGVNITSKEFSEDQKTQATIIAMQAERAASTAVDKLKASAIDTI